MKPFSGPGNQNNDIPDILAVLARRKKAILVILSLSVLLAVFYVSLVRPQYAATTEILILNGEQAALPAETAEPLMNPSKAGAMHIRSQAEIMQSPAIIRHALDAIPLYRHREFGGDPRADSFAALPYRRQERIIHAVSRHLSVKPVIGTAIVAVTFRAADPDIAARTANAVVQSYIWRHVETRRTDNAAMADWLAERAATLRGELDAARADLRKAHKETGLPAAAGDEDFRLMQIGRLGDDYAALQRDLLQTQTALEQIRRLKEGNHSPETFPVLEDYAALREHINLKAELKRQWSALGKRYGPRHPEMIALEGRMADSQRAMQREVATTSARLNNQSAQIRAAMEHIALKIQELENAYQGDSASRARMESLEADIDAIRAVYDRFRLLHMEAVQKLNWQASPVNILYAAKPPVIPAYPQKGLIIGLAAITGLFLGIFTALILETSRNGFSFAEELEEWAGLPVYGIVPKIKKQDAAGFMDYLPAHPASEMAERLRSLYVMLSLRNPKKAGGGLVMTVASTLSGEGKTMISAGLALTAVKSGARVLLIDADMRRPALHKIFRTGNARGLSDYLSDRIPMEDAIYRKHPLALDIMTSKALPTHAPALLNSDRMEALIRRLRGQYDLIVIDTPASLILTDSRITAQWSDTVLYIVEAGGTPRSALKTALKSFADANCPDIGLMLNKAGTRYFNRDKSRESAYLDEMNRQDDRQAA